MFHNNNNLVGGQGTTYNGSNPKDKAYAHIDGGPNNPGYFTATGTEAYAVYTPENTTLTFYYDTDRGSRPGTTYDLNIGQNEPGWKTDGSNANVTNVVFDPSFAGARPTTTYSWFYLMKNLLTIEGIEYLNTSEVTNMWRMFGWCSELTSLDLSHFNTSKVTNMAYMFYRCTGLTSLDLSSFNTTNVTDMSAMFYYCSNLTTIYAGEEWSTEAVANSSQMFNYSTSLVGGQGTTYDANHVDKEYAHIDGGPSNPGYFSDKNAGMRGDVNGDHDVDIADATALINYLLYGDDTGLNLVNANCDLTGGIDIADATALINFLLYGTW
jgi:surface protein